MNYENRWVKSAKRLLFVGVAVLTLMLTTCANAAMPTVDAEGTGFWMARFAGATNYAWQAKTPLVLFWANTNCTECAKLETAVCGAEFDTWMKNSPYAYCFVEGRNPKSSKGDWDCGLNAGSGANEFARSAAGTITKERDKLSSFPYICLYWPQADGTFKVRNFTGRDGMMGSKGASLDEQLRNAIESFFDGYVGVQFADSGSEWDRYEAEPGFTTNVRVCVESPSARSGLSVVAEYPYDQVRFKAPLTFDEQGLGYVEIPIAKSLDQSLVGSQIALSVVDGDDLPLSRTSITFVCPENGSNNPLWTTERTVETLQFGEWTADMDVATQMVAAVSTAQAPAWTLVELAGSLWCPDCYRTDVNFIEDGGKLAQWAKDNRVALVSVDTPHNSSALPNQTIGTIWNRATDQTRLIIDGPDADTGKKSRSGKGYLSRKMVSDEDAAVVAARNLWYSREYFHRPEDYATHRTLIPIFILLDADGKVVGRFETFDARSQSPQSRANTDAYLRRFSEMIEMSGLSDAVSDDNHWSTTPRSLAAGDAAQTEYISHSDFQDVWRLSSAAVGQCLSVRISDPDAADGRKLHAEIVRVDAAGQTTVIASQEGTLSAGFTCEGLVETAGAYYVRVFCRPGDDSYPTPDAGFGATESTSTVARYAIAFSAFVVPQEVQTTVAAGQAVRLLPNQLYRFVGGCDFTQGGYLEAVSGQPNLYRSCVAVPTNVVFDPVQSYVCQLWKPGRVVFDCGSQMFSERDGGGTIAVMRTDGGSGEVHVVVEATDKVNVEGRYAIGQPELVWADGETGVKQLTFTVYDDGESQGLGTLVLKLRAGTPCLADVAAEGVSVTIIDTDKPALRASEYVVTNYIGIADSSAFETINIDRGSVSIVRAAGSDKVPSGLSLKYDKETGSVMLTGTPKRAGEAKMEISLKQGKNVGPASSLTVVTIDPSTINPYVGQKRASTVRPLVADDGKTKRIVGTLTVSVSSSGKIAAKYQGIERKSQSLSGKWSHFDEQTGRAACEIEKNGVSLLVTLDPSGRLTATLEDVLAHEVPYTAIFDVDDDETDFAPFAGYYTVTLPVLSGEPSDAPAGSGYLVLTMTSKSGIAKGKMKYSGVLANGTTVSGTVNLRCEGKNAVAEIFLRKGKDIVGLAVELAPNGMNLWRSRQSIADREVVNPVDGYTGYQLHAAEGDDYELTLDVCGCWYPQTVKLGEVVEEFYDAWDEPLDVTLGQDTKLGTLVYQTKKFAYSEELPGSSITVTDKTGIFKGNAKLLVDETVVSGKIYGVITPGWRDNCGCGQPPKEISFGNGTFVFSHKVNGVTRVDSIPVTIEMKQ